MNANFKQGHLKNGKAATESEKDSVLPIRRCNYEC